jgi:RNase adaptor protein for sRNA GlmZ degradation
MGLHQEKMEATVHSIRSEVEETIKHWVEDFLSCVDQKTQGLRKELTEKIGETQVDLQAIRMSIDMRTKSFLETITDTREHLHEEPGLMIQEEAQMTKTLTDIMCRGLRPLAEAEAQAERGRGSHQSLMGLHREPCSGASLRP